MKYSKATPWFSSKISWVYFNTCFWSLGLSHRSEFSLLWKRIMSLYLGQSKRRNFRFIFQYLKDCYTYTQFAIAGQAFTDNKVRVKTDSRGLPMIIPHSLRLIILSDRRIAIGVTTLLGVHRCIPWFPKVDLSTIVDEFDGITESLSPQILKSSWSGIKALGDIRKFEYKLRKPRFLMLNSASPNGGQSIMRSVSDAQAFYSDLGYLQNFTKFLIYQRAWLVLASLYAILIVGFPFYLMIGRPRFLLGRLAVITSTAGKSRVIGITNYWIQVALKPLHDSIFRILKKLPTDGTFDQKKVISNLLSESKGTLLSSYDLSAATDRLPLQIQKDVIGIIFGNEFSEMWSKVMRFPMGYQGKLINYAVGQPMGAYSSWASLAITHHFIVHASGGSKLPYAVLGDDVVVDSSIGEKYASIMNSLGVKISISKSFVASNYLEFAKRLVNLDGDDYSILGPGLIVASCHNPGLLPLLLAEAFERKLVEFRDVAYKLSLKLGNKPNLMDFGLHALTGPKGLIVVTAEVAPRGGMTANYFNDLPKEAKRLLLYGALCSLIKKRHTKAVKDAKQRIEELWPYIWSCSGDCFGPMKVYHFILRLMSPWPWLYRRAYVEIAESTPKFGDMGNLWEVYGYLGELNVSNINNLTKKEVASLLRTFNQIRQYVEDDMDLLVFDPPTRDGSLHVW